MNGRLKGQIVKPKEVQNTKKSSDNGVCCRKIIIIGTPVVSEPIEKKIPEKYLDQALDNAIVMGNFEKVKKLVEQDGAKATGRHLKTAIDMKEEKIEKYLKAEIEKRGSEVVVSIPSEDGWDNL